MEFRKKKKKRKDCELLEDNSFKRQMLWLLKEFGTKDLLDSFKKKKNHIRMSSALVTLTKFFNR